MLAVVQRVFSASVFADGECTGSIGQGLYVLLGVAAEDTPSDAELLCEKLHKLRIFSDAQGRMNLSSDDIGAALLVVSNFTLLANYSHGNRPEYLRVARPEVAEPLYTYFTDLCRRHYSTVQTGRFGADMRTELSTNGPVTIVLDSKLLGKKHGQKQETIKGAAL